MLDVADVEPSLSVEEAITAIDRGDTLHGLIALELKPVQGAKPLVSSYLAYCVARERGQLRHAVSLCQSALAADPDNPAHYLNLGRVYLLASDKPRAIASFWRGISKRAAADMAHTSNWPRNAHRREHALIMDELRRLGIRKPPPFRAFRREHPLNKYTGLLLARVGLR